MLSRRQFLISSLAASLISLTGGCKQPQAWEKAAYRKAKRSRVAILGANNYNVPLKEIILQGLKLFRLNLFDKRILLKPNLVEYDPQGVINTHPALIDATIEALKSLGARQVMVGEGPGHRRDQEYLLTASGLNLILKDHKIPYVDLNHDNVQQVRLKSRFTSLGHLYLPETLFKADLLVSMPKLKTHHWVGATLSLKNMFGLIPGAVYGWPKNILHWAGINESILDINATLPIPQFAIVDGIVGMEGNGPIQGKAKHCGALILGDDLVAVDATSSRLMGIEPQNIKYLALADQFLGNIAEDKINLIAERLVDFKRDFRVIESWTHLKTLSG